MDANREAFGAAPDRAADAARRRRARPLDRRCSARRCRRRCCWRRSASRRSSTRTASWRPRAPPRRSGVPMIASTTSHFTLEEIAEAGGEAPRWFQLYWPNDRELVESFVGRAEAAGYGAIVVTVDTFIPGWKPRDLQQAWLPFLEGHGHRQLLPGPGLPRRPREDAGGGRRRRHRPLPRRPRQPGADLGRPRLAARADLAADPGQGDPARRRRPRGGRAAASTASSSPTTAAARSTARSPRSTPCRPIAEAVGDDLAVLFDSGVRGGADVLKALALGADAVCLGRPYIWGLALDGQAGRRSGAEDDPRRARPDDGALRLHPARPARPERWPRVTGATATPVPPARSSGRAAASARRFWPPGREPSSASARASSPSAASSVSLAPRQVGDEQQRRHPQALDQVVEDFVEALGVGLVLGQLPRAGSPRRSG